MSDNNRSIRKRLMKRQRQLEAKQREAENIRQKREQLQAEFHEANRLRAFMQRFHPKAIKQTIRTIGAYILGRRNRRQLYSRTYKRKQASNDILPYTRALYMKGFTEKAFTDLRDMYRTATNKYLRDAIAWELALWHARFLNDYHANAALKYLHAMNIKYLNQADKRKRAIITAECYIALGNHAQGKQTINNLLLTDQHPDLYLALANCQTSNEKKFKWINK